MKKVLFLFLCLGVFILGCQDTSNDINQILEEENEQVENEIVDNSNNIGQVLEEGAKLREEKDFEGALNVYTNALRNFGDNVSLYADRGRIKREMGNAEGALEDINKALDLSQEAWIYAERGVVYKMIGNNELSLQDFKKALSMDPSMEWVANNIKELEDVE